MFERALKRVDVIEALPGEVTFAEKVLVNVGDRGRVRIDAGVAGENLDKLRTRGAGERDAYPWLKNSIPARYAVVVRIDARRVQRMNCGADQFTSNIARKLSIGVESYYVTD